VSCDIAVIVPDVKIVWVFAERPGHRNALLAAVASAKARRAGVADLHTEVGLPAATILVA